MKDYTAEAGISVIICAYTAQRWDDLVAAVGSVQRQRHRPLEVIVVIDHNDELLARARRELRDVLLLENGAARGLSGARNSGIAVARGTLIAFLDDDAIAADDWLAQLETHFTDPALLGVGGAIAPRWSGGRPAWFPAEFDWVVGCTYRGMPEEAAPVRNLIGANMAFRREVFATVGGFSDGIGRIGTRPLGCEETELCIRAARHWPGRGFLYEPRARVEHRVPAERARWRYFRARCYAEGLSKAIVTQLSGASAGLATERRYTQRILPRGVLLGLADALFRRDRAGFGRASAIIAGLAVTTVGYLVGLRSAQSARVGPATGRVRESPTSLT